MNKLFRLASVSAVAAFGVAAILVPITSAKEMLEGKTVRVVIGYAAGGGYDRYGCQVARHIGKYLPGKPNVVAVNMPGAGGLKVVNYLYNIAPKDGTNFGIFARGAALFAFFHGAKHVRFYPLKLN